MKKNLLSLAELKPAELKTLLNMTKRIKEKQQQGLEQNYLKNKTLLMFFEKPSLRTRVSFEVGMTQLGGHAIYYNISTGPLGKKESIEDTGKVVSRYCDLVMARLKTFEDTKKLAANCTVPVIDALSDKHHPCQIICDLFTVQEKKGEDLAGKILTYLGDAENNVTYSLIHGAALLGMHMKIGCPDNDKLKPLKEVLGEANKINRQTGGSLKIIHNAKEAAAGADVIYTDSWMSYHIPEDEKEERLKLLKPFQVNNEVMANAKADAVFMNCLPALRGFEQTAEVIDGPQSIVFDQAENRLHSEKAIMLWLLGINI
ncbi:MAG TPA: ornithine carbamoyltransferase [Patescibacteria group bacterium]|nr:ornithine carbamoyltransferase [Patescibacteria group bacterium]